MLPDASRCCQMLPDAPRCYHCLLWAGLVCELSRSYAGLDGVLLVNDTFNIKVYYIIIAIIWCNTCMGCTYSWSFELFLNNDGTRHGMDILGARIGGWLPLGQPCWVVNMHRAIIHRLLSAVSRPIFNRTCWYNQTNASNSFFFCMGASWKGRRRGVGSLSPSPSPQPA